MLAMKLLVVIVVLVGMFVVPDAARYREWRWYDAWLGHLDGSAGLSWVLLAVVAPALLAALLALALQGLLFGLLWLAFAFFVAVLCLYEVEPDIDAVLKAPDRARREAAARSLYEDGAADQQLLAPDALVEATTMAALRRRFGVLFWFFLLGPAGALFYHLGQRARRSAARQDDAEAVRVATRFGEVLDWLPAHLMALAMAVVSDFDAVFGAWRRWHVEPGRDTLEFDPRFLGAIARAGVTADVDAGDAEPGEGSPGELADLKRLLLRVLVVWLAVVAVIVLVGWMT